MAKDFKKVRVGLPASVMDIVKAAGGEANMPLTMATILGAVPWIALGLWESLPEDEYRAFANQLRANMQLAWEIAGAADPKAAFDAALEREKRGVN